MTACWLLLAYSLIAISLGPVSQFLKKTNNNQAFFLLLFWRNLICCFRNKQNKITLEGLTQKLHSFRPFLLPLGLNMSVVHSLGANLWSKYLKTLLQCFPNLFLHYRKPFSGLSKWFLFVFFMKARVENFTSHMQVLGKRSTGECITVSPATIGSPSWIVN